MPTHLDLCSGSGQPHARRVVSLAVDQGVACRAENPHGIRPYGVLDRSVHPVSGMLRFVRDLQHAIFTARFTRARGIGAALPKPKHVVVGSIPALGILPVLRELLWGSRSLSTSVVCEAGFPGGNGGAFWRTRTLVVALWDKVLTAVAAESTSFDLDSFALPIAPGFTRSAAVDMLGVARLKLSAADPAVLRRYDLHVDLCSFLGTHITKWEGGGAI